MYSFAPYVRWKSGVLLGGSRIAQAAFLVREVPQLGRRLLFLLTYLTSHSILRYIHTTRPTTFSKETKNPQSVPRSLSFFLLFYPSHSFLFFSCILSCYFSRTRRLSFLLELRPFSGRGSMHACFSDLDRPDLDSLCLTPPSDKVRWLHSHTYLLYFGTTSADIPYQSVVRPTTSTRPFTFCRLPQFLERCLLSPGHSSSCMRSGALEALYKLYDIYGLNIL